MSLRELPPPEYADDPLLRELAAMAPAPDEAFAAMLDERVASGFAPSGLEEAASSRPPRSGEAARPRPAAWRRGWSRLPHLWRLSPGLLGSLACVLVLAVVTVAVVQSGGSGTSGESFTSAESDSGASTAAAQPSAPAAAAGSPGGTSSAPGATSSSTSTSTSSSGGRRSIARDTTIAITARVGRFDAAAARVPQIVADAGGTVENSTVHVGSSVDEGVYALRVPSARYADTMGQLSALGRVTARSEHTQDVTTAVVTAEDRLGDLRAERDSVRRRLAATTDDDRALELRDSLAALRRQIATQRARAVNLHQRASSVPIQLSLRGRHSAAGGVTPSDAQDDDRGAIGQALHDAGSILTSIGAVAIVVLAVVVPVGVVLALGWRGAGLLRRRRREQGLNQ
jgi:hypothetical protein